MSQQINDNIRRREAAEMKMKELSDQGKPNNIVTKSIDNQRERENFSF